MKTKEEIKNIIIKVLIDSATKEQLINDLEHAICFTKINCEED